MDSQTQGLAALTVVTKGAALLLAAYATAAGIVAFVPEVNDYAKASVLKHQRLSVVPGIDSAIIEQATGCATVNMGMDGRLGVRFLLEETRPQLRRGDIVVAALEYDGFYESVQGSNADQLMIVKANPHAFTYLDWPQRQALVYAVPYVAQEKLARLTREAYYSALDRFLGKAPEVPLVDMNAIESAAGFNDRGDLVSHLGVRWPWEHEDGVDMTHEEMDPLAVPLLVEFTRDMNARGVDVLLSYTSVMRSYFERHKSAIEGLHERMTQSAPLVVPSPPDAFVYDDALFFDTVYHLNAEGRIMRSTRVAEDIGRALGTATLCRAHDAAAALYQKDAA
jgi:hypothetical protein